MDIMANYYVQESDRIRLHCKVICVKKFNENKTPHSIVLLFQFDEFVAVPRVTRSEYHETKIVPQTHRITGGRAITHFL